MSAIGNVLGDAISKVTVAFPKVLKTVNGLIKSLLKGMRDNKAEIASGLAETLAVAAEGIVDIVPDMLSLLMDIGGELLTSLSDELPTLLPELVTSLLDELEREFSEDNIDTLIKTSVALIENLTDALVNAIPILINRLPEILRQVADGLLKAAGPILTAAVNGVIDIINAIFGTNIPHIEDIKFPTWDELKDKVYTWWNSSGGILEKLKSALNWMLGILHMPDVDALVADIGRWWHRSALPTIKKVLDWALGELKMPDTTTIANKVQTWWEGVKKNFTLNATVTTTVKDSSGKKQSVKTVDTGAAVAASGNPLMGAVLPLLSGLFGTKSNAVGGIATGGKRLLSQDGMTLNTVGEAGAEGIIPLDTLWYEMDSRLQNTLNKTFGALGSIPQQPAGVSSAYGQIDYDLLASKIASATSGNVYLDGKVVGKVMTPYVTEQQGAEYASLQRSGYRA